MALKPWYNVVTPREDLRLGKSLDTAEFAVHLDRVRDGTAPPVYTDPTQFFARTYLTHNLQTLAVDVIRRLAGERTETPAVYNLAIQFGGGKTHALTLLYHLARGGANAARWAGVDTLLAAAHQPAVPQADVAVFVGTEFDSATGRGGGDGTPQRRTPWAEIAYQLRGEVGLALVAEHEAQRMAPGGDVLRALLESGRPALILLDEVMNYISRNRASGLRAQFHTFVHNLSETARGVDGEVLVVSLPGSELEMSTDDQADYTRFNKLLERLGKAMVMAQETETAEIIRRRLFEWQGPVSSNGRVLLPAEADAACKE
jgi:predicted AAA+ superfamily ATPase